MADMLEPLVITEEGDTTVTVEQTGAPQSEQASQESQGQKTERSEGQKTERSEGQKTERSEGQREEALVRHEQRENEESREPPAQEDSAPVQGVTGTQQDTKKAHRLSPEFPDALFELLCTLQEGRRMNDQRCSFTAPEPTVRRRRCHSEPNTTKPANRVRFSSMTSLQKEEFFDLVATAQARRLNDQRARLERSPPPKPKGRSFRGSLRQLSLVKKTEPAPPPKEELYSMILQTQAQGRLEDQRSRAPGPMDDEVFFSLLMRVQGGRMDEQRTELPCLLHT